MASAEAVGPRDGGVHQRVRTDAGLASGIVPPDPKLIIASKLPTTVPFASHSLLVIELDHRHVVARSKEHEPALRPRARVHHLVMDHHCHRHALALERRACRLSMLVGMGTLLWPIRHEDAHTRRHAWRRGHVGKL